MRVAKIFLKRGGREKTLGSNRAYCNLLRPADIAQGVCLIVANIQTLRVGNTDSRNVYAHKEALEGHFTRSNISSRVPSSFSPVS